MNYFDSMRRDFLRFGSLGMAGAAFPAIALGASKPKNAPAQPGVLDVRQFGATGDGKTLDTDAVNKAIVEFGDISDIKAELEGQQPANKRNGAGLTLGFSLCGSALIIALVVFVNLYYSPGTIWFVYPVFGVLWWPLGVLYYWLGQRRK